MENIPVYIPIVFALTTFLTVALFYQAANKSKVFLIVMLAWLAAQGIISYSGFYTITDTLPPRFLALLGPTVVFIILLFCTKKGQVFIDELDLKTLTLLHTVRIPVEMVLFWLFIHKAIPELMTFEGRNFDILSGLSAPLICYFGFLRQKIGVKAMLAWNFVCLALLFNIVINAILAVPTPFQKFGFEQPNIGILYFPFVWLPCCIVPLVLLSHLAAIRKLVKQL